MYSQNTLCLGSGIVLAAALIVVALYGWRRRSLPPWGALIQGLADAVIVLDQRNCVVDLNPAAQVIVGVPASQAARQSAETVLARFPALAAVIAQGNGGQGKIIVAKGSTERSYMLHISPIADRAGRPAGRVVILRDVMDQLRAQQTLASLARSEHLSATLRSFFSLSTPAEVLQAAVDSVADTLATNRAWLAVLDLENEQIMHFAKAGPEAASVQQPIFDELMTGLTGWALQEHQPALVHKGSQDPRESQAEAQSRLAGERGSAIAVPLHCEGNLLGVISAANRPEGRDFTEEDLRLGAQIADCAATAFANARVLNLLRESEGRCRSLIDSQTELISTRLPDGTLVFANDAYCAYYGKSRDQLVGHPFAPLVPQEDRDELQELFCSVGPDTPSVTCEHRVILPDGRVRWHHLCQRAEFDPGGTVTFVHAVARDITEYKQTEEALRQSETKHRTLLSSIRSPVLALKEDMTVLYCNEAFADLVGKPAAKLEGTNVVTQFPALAKSGLYPAFLRALEKGRPDEAEGELAGRTWHALVNPTPWGMLATVEDITTLAEARDRALEAARLKSEFLATMSHEVRTPMNAIVGMTELLLDKPLSDEQRDYAKVVLEQTNNLLTMVDNVLDYSRIEAGRLDLEEADFQLPTLLDGVLEQVSGKAREKGLAVDASLDPDIPLWLRGDPGRLHQVLLNVIGNAVKFTEEGRVGISVSTEGGDDQAVALRFTTTDTGIGMPPDVQERLFEPFTQADGSTTRKYGGVGLGLAISQRLVELMGGRIGLQTEEGRGSTVWFTVRLGRSARTDTGEPDLQGLRVLVVASVRSQAETLRRFLRSWNMEPAHAASGEDALGMLTRSTAARLPYDVVIVDEAMSDMDSAAFEQAVRTHSALAKTRLILLTPRGKASGAVQAIDGFVRRLPKPVVQPKLFDAIVDLTVGAPRPVSAFVRADMAAKPRLILLAEDNQPTQTMVLLQLQGLGYSVHTVSNGRQAVNAISVAPSVYGLVLMDCQMPEMDGFSATRAIREAEASSGRRIPIIALTGYASEDDREKCLAAGMDDYISKPVSRERLREVLARWLPPTESSVDSQVARKA